MFARSWRASESVSENSDSVRGAHVPTSRDVAAGAFADRIGTDEAKHLERFKLI